MTNQEVSEQLQTHARELRAAQGNLYRIRAYRRAAMEVQRFDKPLVEILVEDLARTPGIGRHLAIVISNYARTGVWLTYEQLAA
ncbi:helix-hairpin-helix domain-containing protein [Zavarzinella formosa]|uniref:helix-hairpin-helix domain-containing protein n=1 Tax=Zavarzinella formosa TaxID=360055 RepID=UPI0002E189FF|nr:helix-hairpin-helix domain-containing protein [Zavarzinella formosa]